MSGTLDRFLAELDPRDRAIVVLLVEEEAEAHGHPDPAAPAAAPAVATALREVCERLAVELEAEERDDDGDETDDWDRPALPYDDDDLGAMADASVAATPALDALLGRFLEHLPGRRRKGVLRRARRVWERAGVRDPDAPEARAIVRRALLDEALQEGFEPPPRVVLERAPLTAPPPATAAALVARLGATGGDATALADAAARLGTDAVRETLDQAAFLAARGGLPPALRTRWVLDALARRA